MIESIPGGGTAVTGDHMQLLKLLTLRSALRLQKRAPKMKLSRGVSASALAKRNFAMKGNLDSLIRQTEERIDAFHQQQESK
jgi:hypothetical protein